MWKVSTIRVSKGEGLEVRSVVELLNAQPVRWAIGQAYTTWDIYAHKTMACTVQGSPASTWPRGCSGSGSGSVDVDVGEQCGWEDVRMMSVAHGLLYKCYGPFVPCDWILLGSGKQPRGYGSPQGAGHVSFCHVPQCLARLGSTWLNLAHLWLGGGAGPEYRMDEAGLLCM